LGYDLTHANRLYFDRELPLSQCVSRIAGSDLEATDFSKPAKARDVINDWVKTKTRGKIANLLPADALAGGAKVALVNAAYFKGRWQSQFKEEDTQKNNFYVSRDVIRKTTFMEQKGKFNYYTSEELRAHVLELPYEGDDVSLLVVLPPFEEDALSETVSRLTPEKLKGVMAEVRSGFYSVDDLKVRLPKFQLEQTFELSETLRNLGMERVFDSSRSQFGAFLSASATDAQRAALSLDRAVHKTFIAVNEEGSEAAAATALFGFRSARPLFHTEFVADHPFAFLIYDKASDTVLFFGVYQDPQEQ